MTYDTDKNGLMVKMPILMVLLFQQPWQTTSASSNSPHSLSLLLGQSSSPFSSPVQFTKLKTVGKLSSPNTASLPGIAPGMLTKIS